MHRKDDRTRTGIPTRLLLNVTVCLGIAACSLLAGPSHAQPGPQPAPVSGEVLVQLTIEAHSVAPYREDLGAHGRTGLPELDATLASIGAYHLRPALRFPPAIDREAGRALARYLLVSFAEPIAPAEAAARLKRSPLVETAEPNGIVTAVGAPDDPLYPSQWAHANTGQAVSYGGSLIGTPDCDTDTDLAWDEETGTSSVTIAVLDSGIDHGHPEFAGKLVPGYDFVGNDTDPADGHGHGTCCAGIAAASTNNAQGIAGVNWGARIMPVRVLDNAGHGTHEQVTNGILWAADHASRILTLSLGSYIYSQIMRDAVTYAHNAGCAVFCAAGNDNANMIDWPFYPASYPYTIVVGAISPCNERKTPTSCDGENWWGSNYGSLSFLAPGVRMHATDIRGSAGFDPGDYYPEMNGTSAATPHAAGIGALVLGINPALTPNGLETVLKESSQDMYALGVDPESGFGRLNAHLAVLSAYATPTYVDDSYTGTEFGTVHRPYNTLAEGVNRVDPGGTIVIFAGTYDEATPMTITKVMRIIGKDGTATVR
jgi:subtilisin family serine protease